MTTLDTSSHSHAEPADQTPNAIGQAWAARGVWLGLLALVVGAAGEQLLFHEELRGLGMAVLVLAVLLGVLAWNGAPVATGLDAGAERPWRHIAWRRELLLRLAGIAGAVGLAVGSIAAYIAAPNEIFGLQGQLWLGSMGLLLLSCARWYPRARPETAVGPPWTRAEIVLFVGLLALSLVTRLAYLDEIPWRFHFDEGYAFTEIMRYYTIPTLPLFTTTWHQTGLPSLLFYPEAGLMHIVGVGLAGVRVGVALVGALLVLPVYGIARLAWGRTAAALAGFGVCISAAAVHYSRISILNMTTAFWWAACFYFLLRGLRSRRPGDFVWAGLAAGTSMYTYYGTRLLPYLLLAFAAYLLLFHFRATRERLGHLALVAVGFLAGFGPLLGYFQQHPGVWSARGLSDLNVPASIPTTWDGIVADWNVLAPLALKNLLGFSVLPGQDNVYFAPLLLAPEAVLLTLGVGLLIRRWRQPASFLILLTGFGVLFVATLLEYPTTPNFAHWAPAFPVFYLTLALPLALLLGAFRRLDRRVWVVGCLLLAAGLVWDAGANAYGYLVEYPPKVPPDHELEAVQGRFIESVGPNTRVFIIGPTWQGLYPDVAAMMGPHTEANNLWDVADSLGVPPDPSRAVAFVFYNDQEQNIPIFQARYPGGKLVVLITPSGSQTATAYIVPPAPANPPTQ
ncbi:MAG: ArnT family glycosyltransferase [Chloroflexia bacterium]